MNWTKDLWIASSLRNIELIRVLFVKQPFRKATEFALKLVVHRSVILVALASARDVALDHAVPTLPLCLRVAM